MRNFKNIVLTSAAVLALGATSATFAAPAPAPAPAATTTATKAAAKVTKQQATDIAEKAHKDAKLVDITLQGNSYVAHLSSPKAKFTVTIDANSGKIIKDEPAK